MTLADVLCFLCYSRHASALPVVLYTATQKYRQKITKSEVLHLLISLSVFVYFRAHTSCLVYAAMNGLLSRLVI
jgi:hypothetical protein